MERDEPTFFDKKWLWGLGGLGLLVYLIAFRAEAWLVVQLFIRVFTECGWYCAFSAMEERSFWIVGYGLVGNLCFFVFFLFLFSQFILPVRTLEERWMMFVHSIFYVFGRHGPAVFVQNGEIRYSKGELSKELPGVAFVDSNSAVAIEKLWSKGRFLSEPWYKSLFSVSPQEDEDLQRYFDVEENMRAKRFMDRNSTSRVEGPGIVFTNKDERIAGPIKLTTQTKKQGVSVKTRDGIELRTEVSVTFTIGEPPEKLVVVEAYVPNTKEKKFQVAQIEEVKIESGAQTRVRRIIKGFSDVLTEGQINEIMQYKAFAQKQVEAKTNNLRNTKTRLEKPVKKRYFGDKFDPERAFHAFYSGSSDPKNKQNQDWSELPVKIGVDKFRDLINQYKFDDLYFPKDENAFPIKKVRDDLKTAVQKQSAARFEVAIRRSLRTTANLGDDIADRDKYLILPEHPFEKGLLCERRIKILNAGFGELIPVEETKIAEQRMKYWSATWEKYAMFTDANQQLQATRIRNQARAQTQQEMIYTLSQIFKAVPHSEEALAMRVYQALETAASAPLEKKLLPEDTVKMLDNLKVWLTESNEDSEKGPASNRGILDE